MARGWVRRGVLLLAVCGLGVGGITGTSSAQPQSDTPLDLNHVKSELDRAAPKVPGTGWAVDEATQSVLVIYDLTVSEEELATIQAAAAPFGSTIRFKRVPGIISSDMVGGVLIATPNPDSTIRRCTLGFNAVKYSTGIYYALTAGHCTYQRENWYTNSNFSVYMGYEVSSRYGGTLGQDMGVIRYDNPDLTHPGYIHNYKDGHDYDITSSGTPVKDNYVCKSGITTGTTCGYVTNACGTVTYDDGTTLYCMVWNTTCGEARDSGGPYWKGSLGVAIHSGSIKKPDGHCLPPEDGGSAFAQHATEFESTYGISIY